MWGLNLVNIAHGIKSINLIYVGFKGLQRFDNGNRRRSINLIYVGFKVFKNVYVYAYYQSINLIYVGFQCRFISLIFNFKFKGE